MVITAVAVDMEPLMFQVVAQRNDKQASENKMHKKGMVDIAKNEKESKARLVVASREAHKLSAMAQAQKTRK
jgi:ribosome biogenesis protein Tsr3